MYNWRLAGERDNATVIFEETLPKQFSKLVKTGMLQILKVVKTLNRVNIKKTIPKNIIVRLLEKNKDKEKFLKQLQSKDTLA